MTRRTALQVVAAVMVARTASAGDALRVDLGTYTRVVVVSGGREVTITVDELLAALR